MPVYCFTGTERFLIRQKLNKRKRDFIQKYGQDGFFEFDSQNFDASRIAQALGESGLFAQRKMIYLFGVPSDTDASNKLSASNLDDVTRHILPLLDTIDDQCLLVCISFKPDKRLSLTKKIFEIAGKNHEEFSSFDKKKSDQYVIDQLGKNASQDICDYLFEATEGSPGRLMSECFKIRCFLGSRVEVLTLDECKKIVFYSGKGDIFQLFDMMFESVGAMNEAINEASFQGKNWNEYMGLIFWGMRNFLLVMDCLNNGITAGKEIASETGLHPFFINKNLKKIQKLLPHQHTFVQIFDELLQIDYDIKTGRLNDQHVWLVLKTVLSKFSSLSLG